MENLQDAKYSNTPRYSTTTGLLTDYGRALGLKENTGVNSEMLTSTNQTNLPKSTAPDYTNLTGLINGTVAQGKIDSKADQDRQRFIQERQAENEKVLSLMSDVGQEAGLTQKFAEQEGAFEAKKAYDDYISQIEAESLALRRETDKIRENMQGATSFGIESRAAEIERKSLSKQADLAILQNAAARRYSTAMDIAKAKVEMELAPKKAQLEGLKYVIENNKAFQTAEFNSILNRKQKEVATEEENKLKGEEMILNAIQSSAPQSIITKARTALNSGASKTEVGQILGKYSMSAIERLEVSLKEKQIAKLNQELTTRNVDAGELVKINGKDYIRYNDGTISEPILPEAGDTGMVVSRLNEKIKVIDDLTKNKGGVALATSAGSLRGAPVPFLFKNQINNWRAGIINLTQKLTVDELGRVKSDGVTFGQLSNGERLAVGQAATILNSGMIYSGKGDDKEPTGKFKLSEKKVLEALEIIKNGYKLDFERRTGIPYDQYNKNPETLNQSIVDSFIDDALQTNNYGGYQLN